MKKITFLLYGIFCYLVLLGTILYAIGFMGNVVVKKTIASNPIMPLYKAILIDTYLLLLPLLLYKFVTTQSFKKDCNKVIAAPLRRSTAILTVSLCLIMIMALWQPVGGIVWSVEDDVLKTIFLVVYFSGWSIAFVSTFLINHSDLAGLRQVWLYYKGKPYTRLSSFYKLVRHPLYFGLMLAFWCTPVMTAVHLLFAITATGYMLVSMRFLSGFWNFLFGIPFLYRKE